MISRKQQVILEILDGDGGWMSGFQIVKASNKKIRRGVVYVYLGRLEELGLVAVREATEEEMTEWQRLHRSAPIRLFRITRQGRLARCNTKNFGARGLVPQPA